MAKAMTDQRLLEIKLIMTFHADGDTRRALADLVSEIERLKGVVDKLEAGIIQRDQEEVKW